MICPRVRVEEVNGVRIDDSECRRPDNCLYVEKTTSGWILKVHIVNMPNEVNCNRSFRSDLEAYLLQTNKPKMFALKTLDGLFSRNLLPTLTLEVEFDARCDIISKDLYPTQVNFSNIKSFQFNDVAEILKNSNWHSPNESMVSQLMELAVSLQKKRRELGPVCGNYGSYFYDWLKPFCFSPGVFLVFELRIWADYVLSDIARSLDCNLLLRTQTVRRRTKSIVSKIEKFLAESNLDDAKLELGRARRLLDWEKIVYSMKKSYGHAGFGFDYYGPFLAPRRKLIDFYNLSILARALNLQDNPLHNTGLNYIMYRILANRRGH